MARIYVEPWSPEYGAPIAFDPDLEVARVDAAVEVDGPWCSLAGSDDGIDRIALVDGTLRFDARLLVDGDDGPVPGLCGAYAVGAVLWDRCEPRSQIVEVKVGRVAVFASGRSYSVDAGEPLQYRAESVAGDDPALLGRHLHGLMRSAESALTSQLAASGCFVIADGPLNELASVDTVGYVKSHRVAYLDAEHNRLVGELGSGERTPLFAIGDYHRYAWYSGLAKREPGTHPWSAVARCEVPAVVGLQHARFLAGRTTALLPCLSSPGYRDPRAPQNLIPIAGLEDLLHHRLGDRRLVYRSIRRAVAGAVA
ncbi:MAG: hypothetical protein ACE5E8_00740 [Acidimicrobiia bacterium]